MTGTKGRWLELQMLNYEFGDVAPSLPGSWYIALLLTPNTKTGGGTEVSASGYARVAVARNTTNFPSAVAGTPSKIVNGIAITFPSPLADWGTVVGWSAYDASSGGNLGYFGPLLVPVTIRAGDDVRFPPGFLIVTEE